MVDDSDDNQNSRSEIQNSIVSVNIKDILGIKSLGKWATKIVDVFAAGFGTFYHDKTIVSRAKNKAKARLILSKAEADGDAYRELRLAKASRDIAQYDLSSIEGRTAARLSCQTVRQQENIEEVVKEAVQYANEQEKMGDIPNIEDGKRPEEGWIFEFNDLAKNITQEQMRKLFGRVLANEVLSPGGFSIRSLMALKTIPQKEALSFQKICQFYVNNIGVINTAGNWTANPNETFFGLKYSDILNARTAGLVMEGDHLKQNYIENPCGPTFIQYQKSSIVFHQKKNTVPSLPVFIFTGVGEELYKVVDVQENIEYLQSIEKLLTEKECTILSNGPTEWRKDSKDVVNDAGSAPTEKS